MALNISNVGDLWHIKFFRETWFFKSIEEFNDVFAFFVENNVSFHCTVFSECFTVELKDVNLKPVDYAHLPNVLSRCLLFKMKFGDKKRVAFPVTCVDFCRPNSEDDF